MITVEYVEKLGHNKPAYALAMKIAADMIEKDLSQWGPPWDTKALIAFEGTKCVGVLTYTDNKDDPFIDVDLTCVDPAYRKGAQTLILMLSKLRDKCKESNKKTLYFSYSPNNISMKDAARIFGAKIRTLTARVEIGE